MNKLFSGLFVLLVASSNSFAATPYLYDHCSVLGFGGDSSNVKGDRYVLVGSTETYRHEGKLLNGAGGLLDGRTAYFSSLDGDAGSDEYSYQDFKQVAKRNIYFPNRGSNYVQIDYSFKDSLLSGNIIYETICKNINVQSPPALNIDITKIPTYRDDGTIGSTLVQLAANPYIDQYSKARVLNANHTIKWYWRGSTAVDWNLGASNVDIFSRSFAGGVTYFKVVLSDGVYEDVEEFYFQTAEPASDADPCIAKPYLPFCDDF
ncbi:hypothetical protein [Microbulbifer spongiae]|uniref:Uncharacterized protein n=1 Tax=Microbulbifer spongiae TaxID=2944933 RepID=A0ABY9E7H9_9GAMM|nr:hypothetical protein [Microbulbifer sp. MI-G]WKD48973.1 hypothetical protein M8T91_13875 [Microbulbifer sp. MI-G]